MARTLTVRNLYEKKFSTFPFDGLFARAMGTPETDGAWIIWGQEKNGKTWFALKLAEYMSKFRRSLYVSAEEGTGMAFVEAAKRARINVENPNLHFLEYISIEELDEKLSKRKAPSVIFLDNITIYADELKGGKFRWLINKHSDKLFIFLAHEEDKQPYTSTGKLCKKLAKIIVHVVGLSAHVSGRCPGGIINIDEEKAALYWGVAQ